MANSAASESTPAQWGMAWILSCSEGRIIRSCQHPEHTDRGAKNLVAKGARPDLDSKPTPGLPFSARDKGNDPRHAIRCALGDKKSDQCPVSSGQTGGRCLEPA